MTRPGDQPKVSELDAIIATCREHADNISPSGHWPASGFTEIADALAALPQPQAATVGVTDDMVDAALNASWGEDGRPIWSFIDDEHPHALMTTALKAALIGIPGAEKGEAVAWRFRYRDPPDRAWTVVNDRPPIDASTIEVQPLYTAPTSERVQATHRHLKRGSEYVLIGYGKMQAENWVVLNPSPKWEAGTAFTLHGYHGTAADMQEVAIYRSIDDGSLWVRPREEFEDGRFAALKATP